MTIPAKVRLAASASDSGRTMACSYLNAVTTARIANMPAYTEYAPNTSGSKYLLSTGCSAKGISCAKTVPETRIDVLLVISEFLSLENNFSK